MKLSRGAGYENEEALKRLGCVRFTRSFGRKRIVISNEDVELLVPDSPVKTPKLRCFEPDEKSVIESLPQEILIRIICGVDHDDLKQLFHVSTAIREATLVAKECHFAYNTPKKTRKYLSPFDLENQSDFDELKVPNAPKQRNFKSPFNWEDLSDVSVDLFASFGTVLHGNRGETE